MSEYLKGLIDGFLLGLMTVWTLFPIVKRHIVRELKEDDND